MAIRLRILTVFVGSCVLHSLVTAEESRLASEKPLELRSPNSEHWATLLPRSDSIVLNDQRSIALSNNKIVTISKTGKFVRYKLDTPRGEQNIYRQTGYDQPLRTAFDPSVQELRVLENTFRVRLSDYSAFSEFLASIDSHGRAFPVLDRAYVSIPKHTDHERFYQRLLSHPLVRRIDFVFARSERRESNSYIGQYKKALSPYESTFHRERTRSRSGNSETIPHYSLTGSIRITELSPKDVSGLIFIVNEGTEPYRYADGGKYEIRLGKLASDFSNLDSYDIVDFEEEALFELPPGALVSSSFFRLRPDNWEANQVYVLVIDITTNDGSSSHGHVTFATNHDGEPIVTCPSPGRVQDREVTGDPFYEYQWALKNTGQAAFGSQGGVEDEDVRMSTTIDMHLGGRNVHVGIVDTGLDICHPDLQNNVAQSQSINFLHSDWDPNIPWPHVRSSDPYNPTLIGDHGTAMAGVIGAVADNGIAIRGVAPFVWLRGFNYIRAPTRANFLTALGSGMTRHTNDVDIFNLSLGDNGSFFISSLSDIDEMNAPFAHGIAELREGAGALYVKASGNEFNTCDRSLNVVIGCVSSQTDRINSSPYVITVAGLNAVGRKAVYSNAGSNLWLSAPGGSRDDNTDGYPGLLSIDQFGLDRGYLWTRSEDHWSRDRTLNPRGSVLAPGGTSLSNALVSGAIAILLEVNPHLTWRDVKHILAVSSRQVESEIEEASYAVSSLQEKVTTQHAWQTNDAGFSFHNYYGFGALDIDEAVELASHYEPDSLGESVKSDWQISDNQSDLTIPDASAQGVLLEVSIDSEDLPQDTKIEAVELVIHLTHTWAADVQFELTSPSGTLSIVSPAFNFELRRDVQSGLLYFGSNTFYGERVNGTWQVRFRDLFADDMGSVHAAYIRIHGNSESNVGEL